jgi:hypothetical protein
MPVITVDAVTKEPRVFNGRTKWGVKPVGGDWLNLYCDFKPSKGQNFSVSIKETKGKDGRIFRDAEIVGPAPAQIPQPIPPAPPTPQASVEAQFNSLKPNIYAEPPRSGKIPWSDWTLVIQATWEAAMLAQMPPAEAVALVNTTLIAYSNGKLETPIEAGPISDGDAKDDDIPWG